MDMWSIVAVLLLLVVPVNELLSAGMLRLVTRKEEEKRDEKEEMKEP